MRRWLPAALLSLALAGPAAAEMPVVLADIAPVHSLVARVMQGVGAPRLLIPRGSTVRDHLPGRAVARLVAEADLVFFVGRRLTPGLDRLHATLARKVYFVELSEVPGLPLPRPDRSGGLLDGIPPQFWLNPEVARIWLPVIADALAETDPANAQAYRRNAAEGEAEIEALEEAIAARMRPLAGRGYTVPGEGFAHFENAFRLNRVGVMTPADIAGPDLGARMAAAGVVCVFLPPGSMSPALAETLSAADLRAAVLDGIGTGLDLGPDLYPLLIGRLAAAFESCLAPRP